MTEPEDRPPPAGSQSWRRPHERETNVASMVVGAILLLVGVWCLLDQTLGVRMPRIDWGGFWPVILIVIGGIMLYRAAARRT